MRELRTQFPVWLEYSGLPEVINKKAGRDAWGVFKKLVETDCDKNPAPEAFEISVADLSRSVGAPAEAVVKIIEKLKKNKFISAYIPEHHDEAGLFQIASPLPTPIEPETIRRDYPHIFSADKDFFRYADSPSGDADEGDAMMQNVVNLYFNNVGLKMNSFILDELRMIRKRFDIKNIEKVFARAKFLSEPNLKWVIRELFRINENDEKRRREKRDKEDQTE